MKKRIKIALIVFLALVTLLTASFFIYVSRYYRADETATAVLHTDAVTRVDEDLIVLSPIGDSDTALIFYPGAKVEHTAYLPLLNSIRDRCGITCVLVKMPFNMAIFNANAADAVMDRFPEITNWYIGGHSMGGAMASSYAAKNQDKVNGLILLGAYIYGDYPPHNALTVYGDFNTTVADKVDYTENVVVIRGGNHAQFGNYGKQKGDPDATISSRDQQDITVKAIQAFLEGR